MRSVMKIVGLAGESGTGKSMIAAHLTMRGGAHIDTDRIGHEVLEESETVRLEIKKRISGDVFDADGHINRRRLGALVFNDERLLGILGEIIHPEIRLECARRVKRAASAGVPFVLVDGALLLDSRMPFEWDLLIALECDEQKQFKRLMARGGRTEKEVRQRLNSQKRIRDSFHKADVVVDTSRPKGEVLAEVDRIIDNLLNDPGGSGA